MRKIMLYAYTKFNLGDDLFVKVLCDRYPDTKFALYAPKEYKTSFKDIENIKIYPSDSIIYRGIDFILRKLKLKYSIRKFIAQQCDAAVYIGGSLFMQQKNWRKVYENKKSMKISNKPFFLLGANFGPFEDKEFYLKHKELFKQYTDICFRDEYSYNLFKDLSNVRLAEDVIFQLKREDVQYKEGNIVISVIKPSIRKDLLHYDDIYYKKIKEIVVYFIEKEYSITLMSFCEKEGDDEAIEKIINLIPEHYLNKITKHLYKQNMEETINIMAKSDFVVATRFHSMILGWIYNKPVFPIAYSKKMTNVLQDLDFKGEYVEFSNISNLKPQDVFFSMNSNLIEVSEQVKNAEKQFKKLDEYLLK